MSADTCILEATRHARDSKIGHCDATSGKQLFSQFFSKILSNESAKFAAVNDKQCNVSGKTPWYVALQDLDIVKQYFPVHG